MHAEVSIEVVEGRLRVEMTGDRANSTNIDEEALEIWKRIAAQSRSAGRDRILILSRIKGELAIVSAFWIIEQASRFRFSPGTRIAWVEKGRDADRAFRFAEDVAVNRGMQARLFFDEKAAAAWLDADQPLAP